MCHHFTTMKEFINTISSNISWVKDIFTIILTLTATIITFLTYRRARATVLQPIRTEVTKKQVEILTEILNFLTKHSHAAKWLYDYVNLLSLNREIILDDFGLCKLNEQERQEVNQKIGGWVIFLNNKKSDFVYIVGNYDEYQNSLKTAGKRSGIEYVDSFIKNENAGLSVIFFTKQYYESYSQISRFSDNPLLPAPIIKQLMLIKYDGKFNLLLNLEEVLVSHIKSYYNLFKSNEINYESVSSLNRKSYEAFEINRFKHDDSILGLKGYIRTHLRIDEKW